MATVQQLKRWFSRARPGDRFLYHVGFLLRDREAQPVDTPEGLKQVVPVEINKVADMVMDLAQELWVYPIQKRVGDGIYEYIIIRSKRRIS